MKENKNLNKSNSDTGNIRHLKMPEKLWKLVSKASKNSRSVNDYITVSYTHLTLPTKA